MAAISMSCRFMKARYCWMIGSVKSRSIVKRGPAWAALSGRAQASVGHRLKPPPMVERRA
jgi:hypothetical protein